MLADPEKSRKTKGQHSGLDANGCVAVLLSPNEWASSKCTVSGGGVFHSGENFVDRIPHVSKLANGHLVRQTMRPFLRSRAIPRRLGP
jgi:hypothetical protein